jgi:hypothetical protein
MIISMLKYIGIQAYNLFDRDLKLFLMLEPIFFSIPYKVVIVEVLIIQNNILSYYAIGNLPYISLIFSYMSVYSRHEILPCVLCHSKMHWK